jgi:hypothetical protein
MNSAFIHTRINFRTWLSLLAVLFCVRLPAFLYPILDEDEACHAVIGAIIHAGDKPYLNATDNKFPFLWYQYAAVFKIFGPYNMYAVHAFTFVVVFLTCVLLARIGTRLKNHEAGIAAAFAYALFSTASFYKILASNYELHMLLFECLAIDLALQGRDAKKYAPYWFGAGIALGLSMLTKPQGGMLLVSLPIACFVSSFKNARRTLIEFASFGLGLAVLGGLFALFAFRQGYLPDMIFWALTVSGKYIREGSVQIANYRRSVLRIGAWVAASHPLWISAGVQVKRKFTEPRTRFALALLLASFIPVSLGGRYFAHYFLLNLPGLCLLAGFGYEHLFTGASTRKKRLLMATTAFPVAICLVLNLMMPQVKKWTGVISPDYAAAARDIGRMTEPGDRVFVWGWAPEFLVFSKRLTASRFMFSDYLAGRIPGSGSQAELAAGYKDRILPGAWDMLETDFKKHPPALIIDSAAANIHDYAVYPMMQYEFLREYMKEGYVPVTVAGVPAWRRITPSPSR